MKILFITNVFPNPGQPNRGVFNLRLAQALAKNHDIRIISPISWVDELLDPKLKTISWNPDRSSTIEGISCYFPKFIYSPKLMRRYYGGFLWKSIFASIRWVFAGFSPDVVIGYWTHPDGASAARVGRTFAIPSVVIVGGSDVLVLAENKARRRCMQTVFDQADGLVVVSQDIKDTLGRWGVPPGKVHLVPRGVDADAFHPGDRQAAREILSIGPNERVLLWVGRMVPVKGLPILLESCTLLQKKNIDFHLYLVGDGPGKADLQAQASSLGILDRITFVGPVSHCRLTDWYRASDAVVMPSLSEGIPNVLRESISCGTPFVASRVGGIPEIAPLHAANRLVKAGDPVELSAALAEVLQTSNQVKKLGVASQLPTWQDSADLLTAVLEPLVQESQNPDRPWWTTSSRRSFQEKDFKTTFPWRRWIRDQISHCLPRRMLLIHGPRVSRSICLTFDDGPHPKNTPLLLDALKRFDVKATFFLIGKLAERFPEIARRIVAEGHTIGCHSFYHPRPHMTTAGQWMDGIKRTNELFERTLGVSTRLFRPPHGKISAAKLVRLWAARQTIVLWNVDPKDYQQKSTSQLRDWFSNRLLRSGDLILLHDRLPHSAAILPYLVENAQRQTLEFTTVDAWIK